MDGSLIGPAVLFLLALSHDGAPETGEDEQGLDRAVFAGGCFWCMQPAFEKLEGVVSTAVGYAGGSVENPTYEQVSSGMTGHVEAIEIVFDPARVSFRELIAVFWRNIDPGQTNGQFADIGPQYRTVIFYNSEDQRAAAETSKHEMEESGRFGSRIATQIRPAAPFYRAEDYHQEYHLKNPLRYTYYKIGSGREPFLEKMWGNPKKTGNG